VTGRPAALDLRQRRLLALKMQQCRPRFSTGTSRLCSLAWRPRGHSHVTSYAGAIMDPRSVDGVLDSVGGDLFEPCVVALRQEGRCRSSVRSGPRCAIQCLRMIHPRTLTGYSSETWMGRLTWRNKDTHRMLVDGSIKPPMHRTMPLAEVSQAHALMERKGLSGRLLLIP